MSLANLIKLFEGSSDSLLLLKTVPSTFQFFNTLNVCCCLLQVSPHQCQFRFKNVSTFNHMLKLLWCTELPLACRKHCPAFSLEPIDFWPDTAYQCESKPFFRYEVTARGYNVCLWCDQSLLCLLPSVMWRRSLQQWPESRQDMKQFRREFVLLLANTHFILMHIFLVKWVGCGGESFRKHSNTMTNWAKMCACT